MAINSSFPLGKISEKISHAYPNQSVVLLEGAKSADKRKVVY